MNQLIFAALIALLMGGLTGWLLGGRGTGALQVERDLHLANFKAAIRDLENAVAERDAARIERVRLETEQDGFEARLAEMLAAKDSLTAQFAEVGGKLLESAQRQFLDRADARFKQAEDKTQEKLQAALQPVEQTLKRYEEAVGKVEAERRDAFGLLTGQIEAMRSGTERVSSEAAKLVNALRNAPKARGRWGEQQLRNVLESCGLSEHCDFQTEVSIEGSDGRLRPDVIIRVPGGQSLVIDAKVSLNAYQDAFGAVDEGERDGHLTAHTASMRSHINALGAKAYWNQFDNAPDYVVMFVPGEHFLTAALEHDHALWDYAFEKRVLLATPTNLIAIARTVSAVWRQEKMADQAREIAILGKELYARLATMGSHVGRVGRNLDTAVSAYNAMVGSLESQVMSQAKRFEELGVDAGAKSIEALPVVEQSARPLVKLVANADEGSIALIEAKEG
jgi:DNA recombination protein RmuC